MVEKINPNSTAFLFGQIMTEVRDVKKSTEELTKSNIELANKLSLLPCGIHAEKLKMLEEWKKKLNNIARDKTASFLSLRNMLIVAAFSSGLTLLVSWIIHSI